jgi:hypothetical protein
MMQTERYNSEWNVNMKSVSLGTASNPRRRHCSHAAWLILPSCVAVSLQVQMCRAVCNSQLPELTFCTSNDNCPARGLFSPLTSRLPTSQDRLRAHSKRFCVCPRAEVVDYRGCLVITWSRHQTMITNLDKVTCRMKTSTYSKRFRMIVHKNVRLNILLPSVTWRRVVW